MLGAEGLDASYVQGGALGILALVVWWFIKSSDRKYDDERSDTKTLAAEKAALEVKVSTLTDEVVEQRKAKHDALNRQAAAEGIVDVVRRLAPECTCGALTIIEPLLKVTGDQ